MTPRAESLARLALIEQQLQAIQTGWPFFMALLNDRITELTARLIANDSEQIRGRIKELKALTELPETLQQEREGISAELPDLDSAD